jgi:DNA-binding XRE family transcriptional regulator
MVTIMNKSGGEQMKNPTYPKLAQLMAKHGMTKTDISDIIEVSYRNTLNKMNRKARLSIVEAAKITQRFKDLGETVSVNVVEDGVLRESKRSIMIEDIFLT